MECNESEIHIDCIERCFIRCDFVSLLRLEIPDNEFFNEKGIYNYHGGANVLFDDESNLEWIISHKKGEQ